MEFSRQEYWTGFLQIIPSHIKSIDYVILLFLIPLEFSNSLVSYSFEKNIFYQLVSAIVSDVWSNTSLDVAVKFFFFFLMRLTFLSGLPRSLSGKESTCQAGAVGSIPDLERSPEEGIDNLLEYSCMENLMDREALRATVHRVPKILTQLRDWACMHTHNI